MLDKKDNVLYIGSGNSAELVNGKDLSNFTVVCANNAWKLFKDKSFDVWIHSGDFPDENRPKEGETQFNLNIGHTDYRETSYDAIEALGWKSASPMHKVGYTVCFLGLYWIMMELKPKKIGMLGFDHDYNPDKVKRWEDNNQPNLQNQFNQESPKCINKWVSDFFDGLEKDSFYGHGTPDPMRLGKDRLIEKFKQSEDAAEKLGIELVNYSPVISEINILKKEAFL